MLFLKSIVFSVHHRTAAQYEKVVLDSNAIFEKYVFFSTIMQKNCSTLNKSFREILMLFFESTLFFTQMN